MTEVGESEKKESGEQIALSKVRDILHQPFLVHVTRPDRLEPILKEGVLSLAFKATIKDPGKRRLITTPGGIVHLNDTAEFLPLDEQKVRSLLHRWRLPADLLTIGIVVDPKINLISKSEFTGYAKRKFRMRPKFLLGVIIDEDELEVKEKVIQCMNEILKVKEGRVLPVYNTHGDLIWPRRTINKDIQNVTSSLKE